MGVPHGVSPNYFMYILKVSLYILNHLCKYSKHKQTSVVCFHSLVYTPIPLILREELFPVKLLLKPMGLPHGVSPNPPMYIFIFLVHNHPFVYIFISLYTFKSLVYIQVTLALIARFIHLSIYFLHKLL